jgi:hypothetical protein
VDQHHALQVPRRLELHHQAPRKAVGYFFTVA